MVNEIKMTKNFILADGRWSGPHGIGRFSHEVLTRLKNADTIEKGPRPLSVKNLFWQSYLLTREQNYKIFFTPGFNPSLISNIPYTFTIHDLIHLHFPGPSKQLKKIYYDLHLKRAAKKAFHIFTVSEYSKQTILDWANIPKEKVIVVGNGISSAFSPLGLRYTPGFPYLLHIGNTKPHKNVIGLLDAFARARIDQQIKLIFTQTFTPDVAEKIKQLHLQQRVLTLNHLSEIQLAEVYRGALGVTFPSLYEGFGLPVIEGMACGVPVLTSNTTSLPEVAGDAAYLVDPYDTLSIAHGIEQLVNDNILRQTLIEKGFKHIQQFSWDQTAAKIQQTLNAI